MQQIPAAPEAPVLAPSQVTVDGQTISSPQAVYQGFRAQRRELGRQLDALEGSRQELTGELRSTSTTEAARKGLEQRLAGIDERIAAIDKQIAEADAQVARAASVPGAAVELPIPRREGPPEEAWFLGGMLIVFVMLPLTLAYARRVWRRSAKVITTFPKELADRLVRMEQSVEATALEVERIGEGQRFMTKLFTEGPVSRLAGPQAVQRIPAQSADNPHGDG